MIERQLETLDGVLAACERRDEIIREVFDAEAPADARIRLIERLDLSPDQAEALLETRLSSLTRSEIGRLEAEREDLLDTLRSAPS